MEIDSDNVAEIEKYAFLLGSAIKNEDTDQFFSIYDSILPKDLPDKQLDEIKDRARKIVDLPEGEFNSLVLQARHFSLAPAGSKMTCRRDSPTKAWTQPGKEVESDDDDGKFNYSGRGSRFDTSTKISTRSSESDTRRFDDDSGVCNSSKATNSIGSLSDHDGSDDEGRGVSFDYYPPQIKIRSGCGLNLDYDEAHEVKSDHSSQDVNSPRSDFSEGIEMTTFNSREAVDDDDDEFNFRRDTVNYQDDFNTSGESEDENSYRHKYYNLGYRPLKQDVMTFRPSFESLNSPALRTRDVDRGINFSSLKEGTSQYSRYSSYQNPQFSSDRVKIEKNSYKRDKQDPPFGRGPEQFDKVASSIGPLISQVPSDEVKNMPEGRKLEPLQKEDPKRKKKKKRGAKDDAPTGIDENGNPIETRSLNPVQYKQMRESPSSGGGTVANQQFDSYGTFPLEQLTRPNSTNKETDNENAAKAFKRRKKKLEKEQQQKKSEDIENYKGDKPLEELLSFIGGGQNDSNKKAKKNSNVVEEIPSKTQKSNKKNKDKKQKSPVASSSVEEVEEKGSSVAQPANLGTQGGEDNMGNSSGKTDVDIVENGDLDGIYSNSEKVAKSSLKQNDKIDMSKHAIYVNDKLANGAICRESVKEKEPSSTNSKRDIVTGSGLENNKRKSDKSAKASKIDKLEMPTTKSEDTLKSDASLINNVTVKQKNAKNKKNKSLSPPVKVENELSFTDLNHQPEIASFNASENLVNDSFIFTDLEVPQVPKEDEFQVVGKKKKKITKEVVPQNHFMTNNGNSKQGRRHEDKRPVLSQSSNKASVPSIVPPASMVEGNVHLRDLSPSAFPALTSGKGRQSVQEGRRNSTGDVPIPSGLKSQDDSDLESVKSLPATQGSQAVDSILSPRLSYAKMAAGPKVPDSCSSSEKRSSLDSGDCEHDHKKSVWKGSPTERRHSIGSSPEVVNKVTGVQSSVTTSTVKTGSQEHIVSDTLVNLEKGVASITNTAAPDLEETAISCKKSFEENPTVQKKEIASLSEGIKTVTVSPIQMKSSISPSKSAENTVNADSVGNSQVLVGSKPSQFLNNELDTNSTNSIYNKDSSVTNSNVINKGKTCSNNGSNGKKQKSVIFLDKRVEETPENLGISFGFEIDNLVKPGNSGPHDSPVIDQSEQMMQKSVCHSACENVQFVDLNFYSNDLKSGLKDASNIVNSGTSSNSSVISKLVSNTDKTVNSLNSSNNEIVHPVTKVVRMNGIIPPQGHSSNLVKEVTENVSINIGGSGEKVDTEQAIPETTEDRNVEYVYYGESVVTFKKDIVVPSQNNGPTSYCGLVCFIQESDLRSNFNVAEAAAFLTREWDRTLQLQEKDPDSVKVHQN